jgi:hypothetical protein
MAQLRYTLQVKRMVLYNVSKRINQPTNQPTLVKKYPTFYGIRKFITVFTRARHWFLSEPDESILFL